MIVDTLIKDIKEKMYLIFTNSDKLQNFNTEKKNDNTRVTCKGYNNWKRQDNRHIWEVL